MQKTDLTSPLGLTIPFALNGDKSIPKIDATGTDTSSLNLGFLPITQQPLDDGGVAPERIDFNGLFYLATDQRVFLQNGGFITFDSSVNSKIGGYPQDAILSYMDNSGNFGFVRSLIDDNQNDFVTDPTLIDGTNWEFVNLKNFDLLIPQFTNLSNRITTLDSSVVKLSGNQTVNGTKTFTSPVYVPASTATGTALRLAARGTVSGVNNNQNSWWLKLGDGTLFQWGSAQMESGRKTMLISMPTSYSSANTYRVFFTDRGSDTSDIASQKCFEYTSSSSFKVRSDYNQDFFNWFAIGR